MQRACKIVGRLRRFSRWDRLGIRGWPDRSVPMPESILERMRRASSKGKEEALAEGVQISQEMLAAAAERVQGAQVSAPLGRVAVALDVLQAVPIEPVATRGYTPPT